MFKTLGPDACGLQSGILKGLGFRASGLDPKP